MCLSLDRYSQIGDKNYLIIRILDLALEYPSSDVAKK